MKKNSAHRVVVFDIDSQGDVTQQLTEDSRETTLENTILPVIYPDIKAAMVQVPMGFLDGFEESTVANAMVKIEVNKVEYLPAGSSSSAAKEGKCYLVDSKHAPLLGERFQFWPEAAIDGFGILVSECRALLQLQDATVLVVQDLQLGTNDCRGWIRRSLFNQLQQKDDDQLLASAKERLRSERYAETPLEELGEELALRLDEDARQEIESKRLPPRRLYQFRMAFENTQAKGCFKVMEDDVADLLRTDIILPASSVKPRLRIPKGLEELFQKEGRKFRGRVVVGIRDFSQPRTYGSSYQLIENAPEDSIALEIASESLREIHKFKDALESNDYMTLLEILCLEDAEVIQEREEMRVVEAALRVDPKGMLGVVRFPYVNEQLNKNLARWANRATIGGGLRLPGFTLGDDGYLFAHDGRAVSGADWIPKNKAIVALEARRGLCVRYPIRSIDDLLPQEHLCSAEEVFVLLCEWLEQQGLAGAGAAAEQIVREQLWLEGMYVLHSQTAKKNGGDFDFDGICVVDDRRFPRFVQYCFDHQAEAVHEEKNKVKAKTSWFNLPVVFMKARGTQIGRITDLKSSCIAAGENDHARKLVPELQKALDALKWNVQPDRECIDTIAKQVKDAPWLPLKRVTTISQLPDHLPVAETDRIGKLYNFLRKELPDLTRQKARIADFKMLVAGEDVKRAMYEECRHVNQVFAAVVARASERQERLYAECEKASGEVEEAKRDANRMLRTQKYQALKQAHTLRRLGDERRKKEMKAVNTWVRLWAAEKQDKRMAWVQALLTVVCEGTGSGAILLTAFPQEFVDRLAELNRTKPVRVITPDLAGYSSRLDPDGRTFLIEPLESGGTRDIFLFKKGRNGEIFLGNID